MFLCLSSGLRPRYKNDILRAVSMPRGSVLQFRYEKKYIAEGVRDKLSPGVDICIAFLRRADPIEVVPCRHARLLSADLCGKFHVLKFELGDFWTTENLPGFNKEISGASSLPDPKNGFRGSYVVEYQQIPGNLARCPSDERVEIEKWQNLADQLRGQSDFADIPFFYHVRGFRKENASAGLAAKGGVFHVAPDSNYEVTVYQYSPNADGASSLDATSQVVKEVPWIIGEALGKGVALNGNPRLAIDSPYDRKELRFRTTGELLPQYASISIYRTGPSNGRPEIKDAVLDFDLNLRVRTAYGRLVVTGICLGGLIASQGCSLVYMNAALRDQWAAYAVASVLGLLTGFVAAAGLKKP